VVWRNLVRAVEWPQWYAPVRDVRILSGSHDLLDQGSRFVFDLTGTRIDAVVREFVPYSRLSWFGTSADFAVYHTWRLRTIPDGCHVVTTETANRQHATAVRTPNAVSSPEDHHLWLRALKQYSEQ
jgi:hypothetical protein